MGQETRQKTGKKSESARTTTAKRKSFRGAPNEYEFLREEIRKLWTSWAHTSSTSDLWRRIEQSGLDNALKKLSSTEPELKIISSVSSEDAVNVSDVMVELSEVLSCIRLAFADNTEEIFDNDEREKKYATSSCPEIVEIWRAYSAFAVQYATDFVKSSWLNSSEHRGLLSAVVEVAANSAKMLIVAVDVKDFHNKELDAKSGHTDVGPDLASSLFVQRTNKNSSEHRGLLSAVVEVAANSANMHIVAVDVKDFHNKDDTEAIHTAATSEATYLCKLLDDLLTKLFALGDNHTATDGLLELAGWVTYGLTHITDKVVRVGLEARSSDDSIEDHDELIDNINNVLKVAKQKWNVEPRKPDTPPPPPPPQPVPDKKGRGKKNQPPPPPPQRQQEQAKAPEPSEEEQKKTKGGYLETLEKLGQVYQKYSDEAWETKKLPVLHGTAGVQMMYRMECYSELNKAKVEACPMASRKKILDSINLTDGHVLHSDIFVFSPEPMEVSKEVILKFPLMSNAPADGSNIYLKMKEGGSWKEVETPTKVTEDEQTFIVFNTLKCEAFTALSFSPSDGLQVGPNGATYVSDDNGKVEVVVPAETFTSDVTLGIKVIPFTMSSAFMGTVQGSPAVEITPETSGSEMKRAITVQVPLPNNADVDDKETELVVVRYNEDTIQVLDKKQMNIRMVDSGVYAVDFKGFWCIAVLRIKRIFLNMRESVKKEFLIGYGMKVPCNILTFIDDICRGDESQTFVMEVVERRDAENTVDLRRNQGLVEVKRGRSKDILLKRGDQIVLEIGGQVRATEALKDEDCTLCYVHGTSNVVSIPTEIKRDPEKFPDAMVIYRKPGSETWLHSLAIMTRDLAEAATEDITARTSSNMAGIESKSKVKEDGTNILKMESLMSLARELTFDEGSSLGHRLGVKDEKIRQIAEQNEKDPVAGNFEILCWWRGRFGRATMADFLVVCLKAVGKPTYADLIAEVRRYNRCLRKEDFESARKRERIMA